MKNKVATLVLTGLIGLGLGAGIGVAAAQTSTDADELPDVTPHAEMSQMHEMMRDHMPSELADQCDEMHAVMSGTIGGHPMAGGANPSRHGAHHE